MSSSYKSPEREIRERTDIAPIVELLKPGIYLTYREPQLDDYEKYTVLSASNGIIEFRREDEHNEGGRKKKKCLLCLY